MRAVSAKRDRIPLAPRDRSSRRTLIGLGAASRRPLRSLRAATRVFPAQSRHNPVNGPTKPASQNDPLNFDIHRFRKILNGLRVYASSASIVHELKVSPG